jgi:MFS family permease
MLASGAPSNVSRVCNGGASMASSLDSLGFDAQGAATTAQKSVMSQWKPVLAVFVPFALGYYISYLFRTINAVIATRLVDDLGLNASHIGFLTSAYFLTFAVAQLPAGMALDRYGPRRVQGVLLAIATIGAIIFAESTNYPTLVLGRSLIGLGVAGSLAAGLKAIIEFFPKERLPLINGFFIACGAAGAITATSPAEVLLQYMQWRTLFLLLAAATAATAVFVIVVTPRSTPNGEDERSAFAELFAIYTDRFFWRLAPLSALCIGTSWALQGLWAAPWLTDVAALSRPAVVHDLFIMAVALCIAAALIGIVADRFKRIGVGTETLLGFAAAIFIAAEAALITQLHVPSIAPWTIISSTGATTVLSYAILANQFPKHIAGKANAALNVLHIGSAFAVQTVIGLILDRWPHDAQDHYPAGAYATAFGFIVILQLAALIWFIRPLGIRLPDRHAPLGAGGQ